MKKPFWCRYGFHKWDYSPVKLVRYCRMKGCNARQLYDGKIWQAFLVILAVAACVMAASDTLYDTIYIQLKWNQQPSALALDWLTGNLTATLSNPIMQALPYDSLNKIHFNTLAANNIMPDSVQLADTLTFTQKKVPLDTVIQRGFIEVRKYFKKLVRTTQSQ